MERGLVFACVAVEIVHAGDEGNQTLTCLRESLINHGRCPRLSIHQFYYWKVHAPILPNHLF